MRIDQITVQNFRCFENLTLDLHPEFNVLIGDNGAGKTALLDALAVAAGTWVLGTDGTEPHPITFKDVRLVGRSIGYGTSFEQQRPCRVSAEGQFGGSPIVWGRSLEMPNARLGEIPSVALGRRPAQMEDQVRAGEPVTLPIIALYGIGRSWPTLGEVYSSYQALTQRELSRFEGYHDALEANVDVKELDRWLEYQDRVAYQQKKEAPVYRAVLKAMTGIVEHVTDVRFDAERLEVVVEFESSEVHPFAHLSAGQRNMMALAGDIAMRMARLNPQFDEELLKETPGVVLIDEIDLHLHPRWQRHVVADLRRIFPKVQFVTTTHSPQIIGELRPENIIVLGEQERKGSLPQSYGMDTNFILRHAMNTLDRDPEVVSRLSDIEALIEQEEYEKAQREIDKLRAEIGEFADLIRLQTRINKIMLLSR